MNLPKFHFNARRAKIRGFLLGMVVITHLGWLRPVQSLQMGKYSGYSLQVAYSNPLGYYQAC